MEAGSGDSDGDEHVDSVVDTERVGGDHPVVVDDLPTVELDEEEPRHDVAHAGRDVEEGAGDAVPDGSGSVGGARKKVRKSGGHYCCVVGCHNNLYADGQRGIKFYRFPNPDKHSERHEKWVTKVNRLNPDGSLWRPVRGI